MSETDNKIVVALQTGLFPDAATLDQAVVQLEQEVRVQRYDLTGGSLSEADWDRILSDILDAEKVITI